MRRDDPQNRGTGEHHRERNQRGEQPLTERVRSLAGGFETFDLEWAARSHQKERTDGIPTADAFARRAPGLAST